MSTAEEDTNVTAMSQMKWKENVYIPKARVVVDVTALDTPEGVLRHKKHYLNNNDRTDNDIDLLQIQDQDSFVQRKDAKAIFRKSRPNSVVIESPLGSFDCQDDTVKRRSTEIKGSQKEKKVGLQYNDAESLYMNELFSKETKVAMGSNYKNSPTSLYNALRPLLTTMRAFGLFHSGERGGKARHITISKVYSVIIIILLWANFVRYFAVYTSHSWYGPGLFFRICRHIFFLQAALGATTCYYTAMHIPEFFKECYHHMSNRDDLSYRTHLTVWSKIYVIVAVLVTIGHTVLVGFWINTNGQNSEFEFLPFYGRNDTFPAFIRVFHSVITVSCTLAWAFSTCLFILFCITLKEEFARFTKKFKLATSEDGTFDGDMEQFRRAHNKICGLVNRADSLFNFNTVIVYTTDAVVMIFVMYNLLAELHRWKDPIYPIMEGAWLVATLGRFLVVTWCASMLNEAGGEPLNYLHELTIHEDQVSFNKMAQIGVFVEKLNGGIGFTGWKLFTITRETFISVLVAVVAYFLHVTIMELAFNPVGAPNCQCPCLPPWHNVTNETIDVSTVATSHFLGHSSL
ncbi:unnamed protein product [Owenia fusiformis]|uniref:Uncharacterized protein n=1 Tax=Owenia fusiformis TaxID=6347 RepID=A0A8J1TY63_OWEFU|nr:unnamed protein product [Owenia fusiformis]